jgi:hypothetical protein
MLDAMLHLSRLRVVHRDLAARNVLVFALPPTLSLKLADFGRKR